MLVIGRGLMSRPKLLMLDEPSLGIAPLLVPGSLKSYKTSAVGDDHPSGRAERRRGLEHRLITGTCWRTGRIVLSGEARQLLSEEKVKQAYLGV